MQYSQELKEHLAAEKQIAVARANEVAMDAIRVDPQILEVHLAVEATVDASRADAATRYGYTVRPEDIIAYQNELAAAEAEAQEWDAQVPQEKYFPGCDGYYQW
ncbi:hypothetical protein D1007_13918 [Hordeum vulgare]|nr:hypothetical protein D1007_13918 [Hordeum vulgare]